MKQLFPAFVQAFIFAFVVALGGVALARADWSSSLKVFLSVGMFCFWCALYRLELIHSELRRVLTWQRAILSSIEAHRLTPEDLDSAWVLVDRDVREENFSKRMDYLAGGGAVPTILGFATVSLFVLVAVLAVSFAWDRIG